MKDKPDLVNRLIFLFKKLFQVVICEQVVFMSRRYNQNQSPLLKIVYSQTKVNGKVELVPLELYADGSVKRVS